MKKEIKIFSIIILVLTLVFINSNINAKSSDPTTPIVNDKQNSATFICHSDSKLVAGEEMELIIKLNSLNLARDAGDGIAGIGAKLSIDNDKFISNDIKRSNFEGLNGWQIAGYDAENHNFQIIDYEVHSDLEDIFKIKLKVKDNVIINDNDYAVITISNIVTAGGTITGNITTSDLIIKIGPEGIISDVTPSGVNPSGVTPSGVTPSGTTPTGTTPTPSGTTPTGTTPTGTTPTPSGTTPTGNNPSGGGSGNVTSSGKLPQTGDAGNVIVIGSLVGMIALTGFGFIKYRRLDK